MNNVCSKSLVNCWSTVSDTGLDSYADNEESRQQKFDLVSAAVDISFEENDSEEARNATKQHLVRLQESVVGALDNDTFSSIWNYSTLNERNQFHRWIEANLNPLESTYLEVESLKSSPKESF